MKSLKILGILLGIFLLVLAIGGLFFVTKFPDVNPAPNMSIRATSQTVQRGEYLVNHVVACLACHSKVDEDRFAVPIVPGTEGAGRKMLDQKNDFPGILYARNITPAALGDWTDGQIFRAMTSGVDNEGNPLFPVMPYREYNHLSIKDAEAIIAYLRTLPPLEGETRSSHLDFPLNVIVRTMPIRYEPKTHPNPADTLAYGKYLATIALCKECHTPKDDKGVPIQGKEFVGGGVFKESFGIVRSANLTPDMETGIGTWSKEAFIARFKLYAQPENQDLGPGEGGFNTVMPWRIFSGMTEEDLGAIYTYLRSLPPVKNRVEKFTPAK